MSANHPQGKYTLELSDMEGVFATVCLSQTNPRAQTDPSSKPEYEDCRIKENNARINRVRNVRRPRDQCAVPKASVSDSPKTFTRFQCP